tara:strand:+ start:107 stop:496 length:390 start_codon:yes stop_codon:yes gene_type:complete
MAVKLVLLKSGEMLISDAKELVSDEKQASPYAYILDLPHLISYSSKDSTNNEIDIVFKPWVMISKDKKMMIPTDWVVTILDPLDDIQRMYVEDMKMISGGMKPKSDSTLEIVDGDGEDDEETDEEETND